MAKKIIKDTEEVIMATNRLLRDVAKFVERNVVKVDVKIKEGPLLKRSRREVARGLRNLATLVENPRKKIVWVDVKKKAKKAVRKVKKKARVVKRKAAPKKAKRRVAKKAKRNTRKR
jgi:transposase